MLKITGLLDRLTSITIKIGFNEVVNSGNSLEPLLTKFKKSKMSKMTKSKFLAKSENHTNLFKFWNININIGAMGFLIFKAKVSFI